MDEEIASQSINIQIEESIDRDELNRVKELVEATEGITGVILSKIKNPFKRFIYKLAKSNEKTFGSETLECCKLNNKHHSIR